MRMRIVAGLVLAGLIVPGPARAAQSAADPTKAAPSDPAKKPAMRELPSPYTPNYVGGARPPAGNRPPDFAYGAYQRGQYVTATGANGRNYVTRDDAARTAAGALLDAFDGQRILDVTGPAPLTGADIASIASSISGKPVNHIAVSSADLQAGLLSAGLPRGLVDVLVQFDSDAAQGHHGICTDAVRTLSGRDPQSVADFLSANAGALTAQLAA